MASQNDLITAFETGKVEGAALIQPPITTHISVIFLTKTRAYKMKRAVTLPFLDFSTLEKRHQGCLDELSANQPMASNMYLGVAPLVATTNGHYRIGGEGRIVDWLVVMRRFEASDEFDELARNDKLTPSLLDDTADVIARAHRAAAPVYLAGHATDYRGVVQELKETETGGAERQGLSIASEALYAHLDREVTHLSGLIETRRKAGKVRRTHGDLHLRNMCLFEGQPTLFDALEFDERLATTDVLYDLAYLLMDLTRIKFRAEANQVLNRYWDSAQEDESGLQLLPFFASLRACVRMAVAVEMERLDEASLYRKIAQDFLAPFIPLTLAIGGLSGVGKSTIAPALASHLPGPLGARWLRSDVIRKQAEEKPDYSSESRATVYRTLYAKARSAHNAGASVIMDATFQNEEQRKIALSAHNGPITGIWLNAPLKTRLSRISDRRNDPSDADKDIARAQHEPDTLPKGWISIDAGGSKEETLEQIFKVLNLPT